MQNGPVMAFCHSVPQNLRESLAYNQRFLPCQYGFDQNSLTRSLERANPFYTSHDYMIWFQCTGITAIRPAFREHDANIDPP